MTASCVCAADLGDMNNMTHIVDENCDDVKLISQSQVNEEKLLQNVNIGTFEDLNDDLGNLTDESFYYFDKDYAFDEKTDSANAMINITCDNVVIYGKHHTIDARGSDLAKFIVTGNYVRIYDLKFVNFKAAISDETSNIVWNGNKGLINSCDFYNNAAVNGGAICWNGNEGRIEYSLFDNSSASNLGGALYVTGENIKIISTTFNKFTSQLYNEAIYFSNKSGQILRIDDCIFLNTDITDKVTRVLWDEGCTVLYNGVDMSYATIEGLCRDIENLKPGDYYNIEGDYVITNPTGDLARNRIINIKTDNVVIDGNGHIIDCGGVKEFFGLFNITGNNVIITNLRIIHSRAYDSDYIRSGKNIYGNNYNHLTSSIEWHGNNGIISNCQFYDNVGDNGGSIYWTGSNGKIENSTFDDNAAKFGGSIYVSGNDNLIKDCTFNNSYSSNHYEAIYFKNIDNPKLTINNCLFESGIMSANSVIAENGCEVIFEGTNPKNVFPPMSFRELIEELEQLKDGAVYNFDRDCYFYKFDGDLTINANNITINGNGYRIFGEDSLTCLFNIFGNNVQVNDLTFDFNSQNNQCPSFMTLTGENVSISNCVFIGNEAKIGGTVNWYVNNGIIDNCLFINNSARAIYMDGTNNIISNTSFINTVFTIKNNEVIYYVNRNGGTEKGLLTINNCSFESDRGVKIWIDDDSDVMIDGKLVPVTFDQLCDEISNLNENEVYNIYRDYYAPSKSIVIKNDNITINANGNSIIVLDDELNESVIRVEGNGIKINKLTINANSNLRNGSLIDWTGDYGVLSDSTLKGNTAEFGGTVNWYVNNGIIDNCLFINNSARAIYMDGTNNIISNTSFINTVFTINNNEVIYYVNRNGGTEKGLLTINSCSFESDRGVKIWIDDDSDVMIDGKLVPVTFDQLCDEISNLNENEVYNIYRDYYAPSKSIVIKNDNITINANGNSIIVLDDELNESVIRVEGNGIKINKLTINANSNLRNGSLIDWTGDYGVLSDSTLKGNTAEFGGAINWSGNNGTIDASNFINNSAIYAGGAIFIDGANNTISNCNFTNSCSKIADEAIFIGKSRKHLSLLNLLFFGSHNIIDAFVTDINIDYLTTYQHEEIVADELINLYPLIYVSLMKGGVNNYSDDITYYGSYNNQTGEFVFCIVKEFPQLSVSYSKEFIFKNLFELSVQGIFDSLSARTFENMFKITKTEYVSSASDYVELINKNHYEEEEYLEALEIYYKDLPTSKAVADYDYCMDILNVVFTQALTIDCDKAWELSSSAFDNINIDGKGSVIKGSFKDREEDKWAIVSGKETFSAFNITVEGFNTAVENMGGVCIFDHVTFNENKMDYYFERDWGAAILNTGFVICTNCAFINNYAKNGGAIFTQGLLSVENCTFSGNVAYGEGNDICVGDDGQVLFNGVNVTGNGQVGEVHFAESMSAASSTVIAVVAPIVATVAGFIAGAITCNPLAGLAVGALVGGAIGASSAAWINGETFDVNHDRLATTLSLTITSAFSGGVGGFYGGTLVKSFTFWMDSFIDDNLMDSFSRTARVIIYDEILVNDIHVWIPGAAIIGGAVSGISYYFTKD